MTQRGSQPPYDEGHGPGDHAVPTPLDLYLDGLMDPGEAAAFEASLVQDAPLRQEVELQRRINAALKVRFAPPAQIDLPATAVGAQHNGVLAKVGGGGVGAGSPIAVASNPRVGGKPRNGFLKFAAAAGFVLLAVGGAAYWWMFIGVEAPYRQPAQIYMAQASNNFTPEWVCTTDEEFARTVSERFGEAAVLPLATQGVQIVGWAYGTPVLSNQTATLMTRVEGRDVLVLIDRAEKDVNLRRPGDAGQAQDLHLFKRRLGGLVLYEITPLDEPRVIQEFVAGE